MNNLQLTVEWRTNIPVPTTNLARMTWKVLTTSGSLSWMSTWTVTPVCLGSEAQTGIHSSKIENQQSVMLSKFLTIDNFSKDILSNTTIY